MAPKLRDSGDPAEWLRHARSNLSRCRGDRRLPDVLFEDLCLDAQQAVEKALKAVLVSGGRRFPKTLDLAELLHLVGAMGLELPAGVLEAKRLTPYAVAGRYPGVSEDASLQDYEEALRTAETVFAWAERLVAKPPHKAG
jgi:HEPN domain-containing protein